MQPVSDADFYGKTLPIRYLYIPWLDSPHFHSPSSSLEGGTRGVHRSSDGWGTAGLCRNLHTQSLPLEGPAHSLKSSFIYSPPLGRATDYLPEVQTGENIYLVLKLSERTLYLYNQQSLIKSYTVAVGRTGWETPTGRFSIFEMQQNPAWQHPFTGEIIPPGDNNPLGQRWLGFWSDGTNSIGFHGTPNEASIGQAMSHGCVRLRNQDVVELYEKVALGTPVYVVP